MNYLIAILACFVTVSFLLKVGFFSTKGLVAVGIVFAIFTLCVTPRMTELSHDVFLQITTTKEILLNVAVCMVLESVIMIAYCFTCPSKKWLYSLLHIYPGLLVIPALCYFQAQLLYLLPGVDFKLTAWVTALLAFMTVVGGSKLFNQLLGGRQARLEMLFIVNLLIIMLCIVITGY